MKSFRFEGKLAAGLYLLRGVAQHGALASPVDGFTNRISARDNEIEWPHGPFSTDGRDIVNSQGGAVTWMGVNWPSSGETMIPEGLEWQSLDAILSRVADAGFNFIRMPFAIEMVDQIYERNGTDVPMEVAMINALGYANGTRITNMILEKNPDWTKDTTRFEIFDDLARVAASKNIILHPDNHVSKAQWCCGYTDGNAWFGDINFPTDSWIRGLRYVANWAADHRNVVSIGLRNEVRRSMNDTEDPLQYNWPNLVGNFTAASDGIHEENSDLLVFWSGMQYDQDVSALTASKNLLTWPCYKCDAILDRYRRDPVIFDPSEHPWEHKLVYELHLYSMSDNLDTTTCPLIKAQLYRAGFNALGMDRPPGCDVTQDCPEATRLTPVMLSEFGTAQDEELLDDVLLNCLREFSTENDISWSMWSLAGSYRSREGEQFVEDTWGLTTGEWDAWKYPEGIEQFWSAWIEDMS